MKLGVKIGLGFASLLAIAIILGVIAIINMSNVQEKSTMLEQEYVPEVAIANQIERSSFRTMYAMRGYGFTGETKHLEIARENLKALKERLSQAKTLGENSPHLKALKPAVERLKKKWQNMKNSSLKLSKSIRIWMSIGVSSTDLQRSI